MTCDSKRFSYLFAVVAKMAVERGEVDYCRLKAGTLCAAKVTVGVSHIMARQYQSIKRAYFEVSLSERVAANLIQETRGVGASPLLLRW